MKRAIRLTLAVALMMSATSLFAQKFGRINTQEIIMGMPETKEMQTNLETFAKELQDQVESINVEFEKPVTLNGVLDTLKSAEGVVLMDDPQNTVYPTPLECADRDEVFVGRVRLDPTVPSGINMWVVADNIRKGAATNAVQIAERIIAKAQAR